MLLIIHKHTNLSAETFLLVHMRVDVYVFILNKRKTVFDQYFLKCFTQTSEAFNDYQLYIYSYI